MGPILSFLLIKSRTIKIRSPLSEKSVDIHPWKKIPTELRTSSLFCFSKSVKYYKALTNPEYR